MKRTSLFLRVGRGARMVGLTWPALAVALVGCGGDTVPSDETAAAGDASTQPAPSTPDASDASAGPASASCANGETCTLQSCTCRPGSCPATPKLAGLACSSDTTCPSTPFPACQGKLTFVPCACTDGRWKCFGRQTDGDCCEENGPCGTSLSCKTSTPGCCGGTMQLKCGDDGRYHRVSETCAPPPCDGGG